MLATILSLKYKLFVKLQCFNTVNKSIEILKKFAKSLIKTFYEPFSIVTMRTVAIIFFELGVVKKFMQKF